MSEQKNRSRVMRLLLYPDNPQHNLAIMQLQSSSYYAVGICHNKDVYKEDSETHQAGELEKPHFHFIIKFPNPRYISGVAKALDIDERFVRTADSFKASCEYLCHFNNPEKYQYSLDDLVGQAVPEVKKLLTVKKPYELRLAEIYDFIQHKYGIISTADIVKFCLDTDNISALHGSGWIIRDLRDEHNAQIYRNIEKQKRGYNSD